MYHQPQLDFNKSANICWHLYFIIQIYKEYPPICQYKHLAAAVGLTDRYLRPIPC